MSAPAIPTASAARTSLCLRRCIAIFERSAARVPPCSPPLLSGQRHRQTHRPRQRLSTSSPRVLETRQ